MKKLVIYGSAYCDIVKIIDAINRKSPQWEILGFIEDDSSLHGQKIMNIPILGGVEVIEKLSRHENIWFFNNTFDWHKNFLKRQEALDIYNCKIPNIIHPDVDTSYVEMGKGCIAAQGVIIGANVKMGDYVCLRIGSVIGHDSVLEDYAFLGPNASVGSESHLGKRAFVATGASLRPKIKMGDESFVGAGSAAVKDVPASTTVVGVPAKPIKYPFSKKIKMKWQHIFRKLGKNTAVLTKHDDMLRKF